MHLDYSFSELPSDPIDLVINISDSNPKWTIIPKQKNIKDSNSIGNFRSELNKLKVLRGLNKAEGSLHMIIEHETEEIETCDISIFDNSKNESQKSLLPIKNSSFLGKSPKFFISRPQVEPSNPLIDQTVKIYKPTEWIDCISRESRRVFVRDNWIVARILLPSSTKDSIGLKRLTLE